MDMVTKRNYTALARNGSDEIFDENLAHGGQRDVAFLESSKAKKNTARHDRNSRSQTGGGQEDEEEEEE